MTQLCPRCGSFIIANICSACGHTFMAHPHLQNRLVLEVNPVLKKRLEWRENLRKNTGMPSLPSDPTRLNPDALPKDMSLEELEEARKKLKRKGIEPLEF